MSETTTPETQPALLKPAYSYTRTIFAEPRDARDSEVIEKQGFLHDALWLATGDYLFHDMHLLRVEATDEQTGERIVLDGHDAIVAAAKARFADVFAMYGPRAAYEKHLKAVADARDIIASRAGDVAKLLREHGAPAAGDSVDERLTRATAQLNYLLAYASIAKSAIPEIQ